MLCNYGQAGVQLFSVYSGRHIHAYTRVLTFSLSLPHLLHLTNILKYVVSIIYNKQNKNVKNCFLVNTSRSGTYY